MRFFVQNFRLFAFGALATLILGLFVGSPPKAWAADQETNLGVVSISCFNVTDRTISYSGGVGDYFYLYNYAGTCSMSDPDARITGEGALAAGSVRKIIIVSAGTFTVTGEGAQEGTFTIVAHPIFANEGSTPTNPVVDLSCNSSSSRYVSQVVFFSAIDDIVRITNDSGSRKCAVTASAAVAVGPSEIGTDSFGDFVVKSEGSFTLQSVNATTNAVEGLPITITLVEDTSNGGVDLGTNATAGTVLNYTDVFFTSGNNVDATVTLDSIDNLEGNVMEFLDESVNPNDPNWGISPSIDVAGGADAPDATDGSATFTVQFELNGSPVTLSNVSVTLVDIDRSQFISAEDVESYTLSSDPVTALSATRTGNVLTVRDAGDIPSSDTDQDHWVVLNFGDVSSMTFTVGTIDGRGASFGLVFTTASWASSPTVTNVSTLPDGGSSSSPTTPSRSNESSDDDVLPAIALSLDAVPNQPLSSASAFIEGEGLRVSSPYTLQLGPSGRVLYSGTVGDSGRFNHTVGLLTGLAPGQYFVELRATGTDGTVLVLTQAFTVGAGGVITFVGPSTPGSASGSGLANTGVDASMMMLGGLSLLLLLAGMASVAASRLRSRISA